MKELDIQEALKLANELDALHQYVPSEAPAMIRRLVEELDKQSKPVGVYDGKSLHIYTPQTKTSKCIVKDCENHKHQGGFTGDLCNPCYEFIATGKGVYSQAYRNTQTKPLSDEEIINIWLPFATDGIKGKIEFARAIEERHGIK